MAFKKINLTAKVQTGRFKMRTFRIKGGAWRLQISMPHSEFTIRFGEATRFDFYMGDGEDAGKLAIKADPEGALKAQFFKSAVLFRLPHFEGVPEADFATEDPARAMKDGMVVIVLPTWWTKWKEILAAREVARRKDAAEAGRLSR